MLPLTRRRLLALLASTALCTRHASPGRAAPNDHGIGGTGAAPPTDDSDRGIGGTGVIGTIRKFGSIVVNDMRIAYPADTVVRVDGQPASVSDLRIGQVVRVAARGEAAALSTRSIAVTSEVVGPVEAISARQMTVLGQAVSLGRVKAKGLTPGDIVAVSGLRRNDGTIVASLIERREAGEARVAGPVTVAADGGLRIGGLKLSGMDPDLIGHRAIVEGQQQGETFVVAHATTEAALLPGIRRLSVESYVQRRGDGLALGSGFAVGGLGGLKVPIGPSVRAVLTTSVGTDGRLQIESLRAGGKTYGTPRGGGKPGGAGGDRGGGGAGGRSPMPSGPSGRGPDGGGGLDGRPGGFRGGGFGGGRR